MKTQKRLPAYSDGEEVTHSAVRKMNAMLRNTPKNAIAIDPKQFILSDKYIGVAKYDDQETTPFDIETGKIIARKKAFAKYNKAMTKKFSILRENLSALTNESLFQTFNFDSKVKEINRKLKKY
jgi:hypothetical protein